MTDHFQMKVTTPGDTDVVVTRAFSAPPALVYRAFVEPRLVQRWMLGPPGWTMPVCEIDLRRGGAYRYRWRNEEKGKEFGFFGTFEEIEPERRIVHTELPDWEPEASPALVTTSFASAPYGTMATMSIRYASAAVRAQVLATGMVDGMSMTYDRLDGILAELHPA